MSVRHQCASHFTVKQTADSKIQWGGVERGGVGWGGGYITKYIQFGSAWSVQVISHPTQPSLRRVLKICVSVCLCVSVYMEQHGFYWTDFHEILNPISFRKPVDNIHVALNYSE